MDRYFETSKESLKLNDLHEIGIVAMFIASKYLEVEPLTLDLMYEKIAHRKISEEAILNREKKILCALKFKLGIPNVFNFIESYVEVLSPKLESDKKVRLKQNATKLAKKSILDRKKAFMTYPSVLAEKIINKASESDPELCFSSSILKNY